MKRVLILINELSDTPTADEQDVLEQARLVEDTLINLGYDTARGFMGLDLARVKRTIISSGFDIVFNLVEGIDGKAELTHFPPALLQSMHIPFTGSGPDAMMLTSNKQLAKRLLESSGISTPVWFSALDSWLAKGDRRYIAKPLYEDASVGISDSSIFNGNEPDKLAECGLKFGKNFFVEEFIDGREFNISVIAGDAGPVVLPPAEILFTNYPEGKPNIVGYEAKWDSKSFEYNNTPRSFEFSEADRPLIENLRYISERCWKLFDLRGYARVDFRVGIDGKPYVLEINANPCLSPDSGFYAAVEKAGLSFEDAVNMIIKDCVV
ncbi:MAG: ATP-grasp domain-containing protein [Bacteroidia bacterium]|nr:MAG: ATP-grasp domain-containing protein [Bacteroidia bacterium]